jgi:hypothetical protein
MQIWLKGDLMQSQVLKVIVPELLGPQQRKVILHVFLWEILAKMTQVSDVAPGPLVCICKGSWIYQQVLSLSY